MAVGGYATLVLKNILLQTILEVDLLKEYEVEGILDYKNGLKGEEFKIK